MKASTTQAEVSRVSDLLMVVVKSSFLTVLGVKLRHIVYDNDKILHVLKM
jgi:hypothetical protein